MYINKSGLHVGEKRTIVMELNNTGGSTAEHVWFKQTLPEGFIVEDMEHVKFNSGVVSWHGEVEVGRVKSLEYTIYSNYPLDEKVSTELIYHDFEENE